MIDARACQIGEAPAGRKPLGFRWVRRPNQVQGLVVVSPKDHIVDVAIAVQRYSGAHGVKRFVLGLIRADDVPGARAPELVRVASYSPWLNLITGGGIGCVSLTNSSKVSGSPHTV